MMSQGEYLLNQLLKSVQNGNSLKQPLILKVGGLLIEGELISSKTYAEITAQTLGLESDALQNMGSAAVQGIHLRNVRVHSSSEGDVMGYPTVWRVYSDAIEAVGFKQD